MILNDSEVDTRLEHKDNLCVVIKRSGNGRGVGDSNLESPVRDLIARLASEGADRTEIAEEFGVSESLVSKTSKGLVGNRKDERLSGIVSSTVRDRVEKLESTHDRALDVLMDTLAVIQPRINDPGNVSGIKTKDLTRMAADMSRVAANLRKKDDEDSSSGSSKTQVVIITPGMKRESEYEAITV